MMSKQLFHLSCLWCAVVSTAEHVRWGMRSCPHTIRCGLVNSNQIIMTDVAVAPAFYPFCPPVRPG
jgi:hypothetical protein